MILLASASDKLQVVTSAAGDIDAYAPYIDAPTATPGSPNGGGNGAPASITTATTTDLVAGAASTLRSIREVSVVNSHASVSNTITVQWTNGTVTATLYKVVLAPGEKLDHIEGLGWVTYATDGSFKQQTGRMLFKALAADDTGGQNVLTAQPWFPTAGGGTVAAATSYFFDGLLRHTRAAGAGSHTTNLLFGGTATLTNIDYIARTRTGDVNTAPGTGDVIEHIQVATGVQVKAASTATTEDFLAEVNGIVRINAGGTFIPQFQYVTTAPGGAPTIKRGTFFRMWPIGDNNVVSQGTWA